MSNTSTCLGIFAAALVFNFIADLGNSKRIKDLESEVCNADCREGNLTMLDMVRNAEQQISGSPNEHVALNDAQGRTYVFRTDSDGQLQFHYKDGWSPVNTKEPIPACHTDSECDDYIPPPPPR